MATKNKRGKSWQLTWSENGKQHRKSFGEISETEAERARIQKEFELGEPSVSSPYFDYFAAEYLTWYEKQYPSSFERTRQIVVGHLSPHFGSLMLENINGRTAKNYQLTRLSTGITIGTYLKEFRCLNAMMNRGVEWEYILKNPISHIKPPKDTISKPPHFYTKEELQEIYKSAIRPNPQQDGHGYRWQWQFVANTGLRLSEAIQLNLKRDIRRGKVYVLSTEQARNKSGKWREIPLFSGAQEALNNIDGTYMFDIVDKSISRAFKRDVIRAGHNGSFHSLRHSFISHLAMSGKFSMTEIQYWAGHSSITTTQRYQHLIPNYREIDLGVIDL